MLVGTVSMLSLAGGYMQVIQLIYLSLLGFDTVSIGLLASLAAIAPLRMVGYGIIADKYGRTKVLAFIYLTSAVYFTIYYFTTEFTWFVLAALIAGGSMGGVEYGVVIDQALLADKSNKETRTMSFSIRSFFAAIFSIVGNSLSSLPEHLQTAYGMDVISSVKPLFLLGALICLGAMLSALSISEDITTRKKTVAKKHLIPQQSRGLILRLSLSSLIMGIGNGVFYRLVSLWFWLSYNVEMSAIGYILAGSKIVEAPTFLLAPFIASKLGLVRSYLIIRLLGMGAFSLMPLMPTAILAAITFAVRSAIMHLALPLKTSYMMAQVTPEERASAASLIQIPGIIPRASAIALGGYLMEYVSTALPVYISVAAFSSEAVYYYFAFRKLKPPEERMQGDAHKNADSQV
ncbi:MAG: MFS transporter [Candidatus Bathyarchaeota archaeon]|nr:MAG: MFS transporter [Candidatus Bathyarchaeota archaeon]